MTDPFLQELHIRGRRRFLQVAAATALGVLVARPALAGPQRLSSMPDLAELNLEHFRALLGTRFRMELEDGSANITLVEAVAVGPASSPGRAFRLIFRGGPEIERRQQIYHLSHPLLGRHAIFLVPAAAIGEMVRFSATFNRTHLA